MKKASPKLIAAVLVYRRASIRKNLNKMLYAWNHLEVGGVIINDIPSFRVDNMPYGGVKDSGLGREGIQSAIRDMQEERVLAIKL